MKVGDANDPLSMMMMKRMVGMIRMIINDTYKSAPSQKCNYGSTVFVAIYIKSKIFIGLELLISFRNTVTASMKNISAMNDGEDDDEPFPIQRHVCKLKCSFIINMQQEQR